MQTIKRVQLFGLFFAICLLILALSSRGDPQIVQAKPLAAGVSVSGIVFNQVTQTVEEGADVGLYFDHFGGSPNYSTKTDANGSFGFSDIPQGTYVIVPFPPAGYIGTGRIISVGSSNITDLFLTFIKVVSLLSPPTNSIVEVPHPWLCWEGMPQADSYVIQINRKPDGLLINNPQIFHSACFQAQGPFVNGVLYSWQVAAALNAQGTYIGSTGNAFLFTYKTDPVLQAVNQGADTTLTSWDGSIQFNFPSGSLEGTGTITYQRNNQPPAAFPRSGIGKAYELSSTASLESDATYTVIITYSDAEVLGTKPETLALYAWDSVLSQWVKEPSSQLNVANHTITATPNHFSTWSVMADMNWIFLPAIRK